MIHSKNCGIFILQIRILKMSESVITDIYVGKYVLVQLVDETVELTVENNVYSLTESVELEQDLLKALHELRTRYTLPELKRGN